MVLGEPITQVARVDGRLVHSYGGSLRLCLMGVFELTCDRERIHLPLSAQRVIAFLGLHDRPLLRTYVAGTLWLDSSEGRSHGSLRRALWRLRRPGYELVRLAGETISLAHEVVVDVRWMTSLARRLAAGDYTLGPGEFDELAVGGDLLPGWYDDWVVIERERAVRRGAEARAGLDPARAGGAGLVRPGDDAPVTPGAVQ